MTLSVPIDPAPTGAPEPRGTIEAYTAAPGRMDITATILHNGFLLFGPGLLLAGFAVAGRGRWLAVIGALAGGIGFVDLSGAVLIDWFHAAAGRTVGIDATVRITELSEMAAVTAGWFVPMAVGAALGPILLLVGFVRASIVGRWVFAVPVVIVALSVLGVPAGQLGTGTAFALIAVLAIVLAVALRRRSAPESASA